MEAIEVSHLTFSYDGKNDILKDVSFSIPKGSYTTIIGHNGSGKKVLLFSSFTSIFDSFIEEFKQRGIKYHMITGAVDKKKRKEEVDAFQSDDSDVFLISLKAGGTGLNLTKAQAVIHYDPWWNVSAQNQATDRAYRIGQTKNVLVYQLLMKNTIEAKIYEMQKRKKEMSDIFVENSNGGISTLSKEELRDLFSME